MCSDTLEFYDPGPVVGIPPDPTEIALESPEAAVEVFAQRSQVLSTETPDLSQLALAEVGSLHRAWSGWEAGVAGSDDR